MKISKTLSSLKDIIVQYKADNQKIGFVPTMGNLHAGHIELVNQAKLNCDKVVVSIFVNPLQFNESSDFNAYPKTLDDDQQKLIAAQADCLFLPNSEMMYPNGQQEITKICVPQITQMLEGEHRPRHFDGVSTVVNKLFNLVQPNVAYFGEKDYQQLLLIKKMLADLNMPIDIQAVPTHREKSGLAMSSRNSRLTAAQKKLAPELYKALQQASALTIEGQKSLPEIEQQAQSTLQKKGFEVEYISIRDRSNLKISSNKKANRLVLAAVCLGEVRLIDNLIID